MDWRRATLSSTGTACASSEFVDVLHDAHRRRRWWMLLACGWVVF